MSKSVEEHRTVIKKILDEYYELLKLYNKCWIQVLPYEEVPEEMLTGEVETDTRYNEKLRTWKMIPSDVTEEDIAELEKVIGIRLPAPLIAYYTSYYHLFTSDRNLSENTPMYKMSGIYDAYDKLLIKFGYLSFTWDACSDLFCMKVDENNQDCGIYLIDHGQLFAFDIETVTAEDINKVMRFEAKDFCDYLYNNTVGVVKQ